jgi:excisionase family DNA binding protein
MVPMQATDRNEIRPLMTVEELAAYVRRAPRTVRQWVRDGRVPHKRAVSGPLFDKDEIDRWLAGEAETAA